MPRAPRATKPLKDIADLPTEPPAALKKAVAKSRSADAGTLTPTPSTAAELESLAELLRHAKTAPRAALASLMDDALARVEKLRPTGEE